MRWIITALLFAGSLFGQPIEGPYLIYYDSTQTYFGQPFFVWRDSVTAQVYYGKNVGDNGVWGMRNYSLNVHRFTVGEVVLRSSSNTDDIHRLIVSENRWAIFSLTFGRGLLVIGIDDSITASRNYYFNCSPSGSSNGFAYDLLHRGNDDWTFGGFIGTIGWDGNPPAFCGLILNIDNDVDHEILSQNEELEFPKIGPSYLNIIELDADSFAVFHNTTRARSFISLVGQGAQLEDSMLWLDQSNSIRQVLDVERIGGSTFRVLGTDAPANSVFTMVRNISVAEQMAVRVAIDGDFEVDNYCRVPGYGWALLDITDSVIRLLRVSSDGTPTSNPGLLATPEPNFEFEWAKVSADTNGTIFVYYGEVTTEFPYHRKVQYFSLDWDSPLDTREFPAPVPNEISLTTYPNPFNSTVRIDYELPHASDARVSIFNTLGEEVATLFDGHTNAGTHMLSWSPNGASGVYFVKLVSGDFVTSRKILYIR
jgi:hypothetical protein